MNMQGNTVCLAILVALLSITQVCCDTITITLEDRSLEPELDSESTSIPSQPMHQYQYESNINPSNSQATTRSPQRIRVCGRRLVQLANYICNGKLYSGTHSANYEITHSRYGRSTTITDECCRKSCTSDVLKKYCG